MGKKLKSKTKNWSFNAFLRLSNCRLDWWGQWDPHSESKRGSRTPQPQPFLQDLSWLVQWNKKILTPVLIFTPPPHMTPYVVHTGWFPAFIKSTCTIFWTVDLSFVNPMKVWNHEYLTEKVSSNLVSRPYPYGIKGGDLRKGIISSSDSDSLSVVPVVVLLVVDDVVVCSCGTRF